jgi:hypothetical protein
MVGVGLRMRHSALTARSTRCLRRSGDLTFSRQRRQTALLDRQRAIVGRSEDNGCKWDGTGRDGTAGDFIFDTHVQRLRSFTSTEKSIFQAAVAGRWRHSSQEADGRTAGRAWTPGGRDVIELALLVTGLATEFVRRGTAGGIELCRPISSYLSLFAIQ